MDREVRVDPALGTVVHVVGNRHDRKKERKNERKKEIAKGISHFFDYPCFNFFQYICEI